MRRVVTALVLGAVACNGNPLLMQKKGRHGDDAVQGHESHGGDRLASIFVSKGYRIYAHLMALDPGLAPLAAGDIARLRDALEATRIDPVDLKLVDSAGDQVDARVIDDPLYRGRKAIQLDRARWEDWFSKGADVYRLVFHEYLWVLGFDDANYRISNQLGLFDDPPSGVGVWTAMNSREAPALDDPAAVAVGGRMLVLSSSTAGNCSGQVKVNAYDGTADAWAAVRVPDSLSLGAGFGSAAVGDGLMIFGGVCTGALREIIAYRQTAALYVASSDEWRAVSVANAPAGRRAPLMVASDHEVLVWGGSDASGRLENGAVYDRTADAWRAVSSRDAPPAGQYGGAWAAGAAGAGIAGKFLVWKKDAETCAPTAYLYDPAADKWAAKTSTAAPAFGCHWDRALWTGGSLVFYFEYPQRDEASGENAAGVVWDPALDAWAKIPAPGAPSQRANPSLVWAEDKLVVFGGTDIDGYELNSGAFFAPATHTWTALRWEGAPNARTKNVALWLNGGLVVWGGRSITDAPLKGGAVWRP